jgi:hypothetical protein
VNVFDKKPAQGEVALDLTLFQVLNGTVTLAFTLYL